jgi:ATP/maltotriose-dependent transcriptional regulator MalT
MIANIARTAAGKIPWEKLLKVALPIAIEETKRLLSKIGKRKSPPASADSSPEAKIAALEAYVGELEADLKEAVEVIEKTTTDLSTVVSGARVLTARIAIALSLSAAALICSVVCLFLLLHR